MCGLFGAFCSNTLSKPELERVIELGFVSSLRGIDSTGLAIVKRKNHKLTFNTLKEVDNPVSVLAKSSSQKFLFDNHPILVLGHARAATYGAINLVNAHPIQEGRIIGAHNGTMWAYAPSKEELDRLSDSRLLFRAINQDGVVKALGKTKTGAYALSYINTENRTLNFIRNADRPLHFIKSKDGQTLYWASERRFLVQMLLGHIPSSFEEPFTIGINQLYSISIDKHLRESKIKDINKEIDDAYPWKDAGGGAFLGAPWMENLQGAVETKVAKAGLPNMFCKSCRKNINYCQCKEGRSFIQPFDWQVSDDGTSFIPSIGHKATSVPAVSRVEHHQNITWEKLTHYKGFQHKEYLINEARELLDTGCMDCGLIKEPHQRVFWYDKDGYVCDDCYQNPDVKDTVKELKLYESIFYVPLSKVVKDAKLH